MDTDFILALAKAAVGQPEPEPESEPERPEGPVRAEDQAMRISLSLSREVVCHQDKAIGIGGVYWQASIALSFAMDNDAQLFASWSGLRVLELGCGTGLCGLTAWRLGAQAVVLTDVAQCGPLVQHSAASTREAGTPPPGTVTYAKLRWGDPVPEEAAAAFDIVLGSDLTYNIEDHEPLLSTLRQVCRRGRSRTRVVLAHQSRPLPEVVRACTSGSTVNFTQHATSENFVTVTATQDPLPTFIAKAQELGFCLTEPKELPAPVPEWYSGPKVHTIAQPVIGFAMALEDLPGSKQL